MKFGIWKPKIQHFHLRTSWEVKMEILWSKFMFFWNYFFLWIVTLEASIWKTKLDGMFIFRCWSFENFSFWPIKSADVQDSGHQSKIWTRWRLYNYLIQIGSMFSCNYEPKISRTHQLWDSFQIWKMMLSGSAQ